jgi:hypothetical protein
LKNKRTTPKQTSTRDRLSKTRSPISNITTVLGIVVAIIGFLTTLIGNQIGNQSANIGIVIRTFIQDHVVLSIILGSILILLPLLYFAIRIFFPLEIHLPSEIHLPPDFFTNIPTNTHTNSTSTPPPSPPQPSITISNNLPSISHIDLVKSWMKEDTKFQEELRSLLLSDQAPIQHLKAALQQPEAILQAPDPPERVVERTLHAMHIEERIYHLEQQIAALQQLRPGRWIEGSTVMNNVVTPVCNFGLLALGIITILISTGHH